MLCNKKYYKLKTLLTNQFIFIPFLAVEKKFCLLKSAKAF